MASKLNETQAEELRKSAAKHALQQAEMRERAIGAAIEEEKKRAAVMGPAPMGSPMLGTTPSSTTKAAPGTASGIPEEPLMDVIKRYVAQGAPTAADYNAPKPASPPKPYEPPKQEPHGMWRWFSEVFGFGKVLTSDGPGDFLVPVFPLDHWSNEVAWYVPDTLPNEGLWEWPEKATAELCFALFNQGDRTLIHGPTGAGKSTLVYAVAHKLNIPVIRVNCHRDMQSTDFLGKDIIKSTPTGPVLEYDWSLTTLAAKHGGILLIDEAFRSPCLMSIQSLLERHGTLTLPDAASLKPHERRIVPPKEQFWIALTDNTVGVGDESGAYTAEVQDASTLDRITAVIHVPYMNEAQEFRMLKQLFPKAPDKVVTQIVKWADRIRAGFINKTFQHSLSPRGTAAVLRRYLQTGNMVFAIKTAFMDKLTGPEHHAAKEAWFSVNGKELKL